MTVTEEWVNEQIKSRLVHEIHTSERKSFRGCRRRWDWIFREYYYPKVTAKPLEFGVAFHNAMEVLYNPDTWQMDREIILNAAITEFSNTCNKQRDKYLEIKKQYQLNTHEDEEDYDERVALGVGMLKHFGKNIMPEWDKNWKPKHVEIEFIVPIQNPDTNEYLTCWCKTCQVTARRIIQSEPESYYDEWEDRFQSLAKSGLPVCLAGRIDCIMEDANGNYWIVDWKTAATISRERGDEFLFLDDQINSYLMALRRKLGIKIRGFVYVELRKAFPEPPARNKSIRLGRAYSVSKSATSDYDTYLKTVRENDAEAFEAGLYDEHLEYLKTEGPLFAYRYQIHKADIELEEVERVLFTEVQDMIDPDLRIYPNPGRFNCGFCAFRQPCMEQYAQGDVMFTLEELFDRRAKHYWVKELSTDKQGGE